jgi:sterol 3beta-glucosyltransferase
MKIAIATLGTRGDVQPYLALAKQLQARGHSVTLAAPENFGPWIEGQRIPFHSLGIDMESLMRSPQVRSVLAGNWTKIITIWRSTIIPMVQASLEATAAATRNAEVVLFHPKAIGAADVAEATGARAICASPLPFKPTGEFPLWVTHRQYPRAVNRITWQGLRMARAPYRRILNQWRRNTLGLGKGRSFSLPGAGLMHLCAVSPSVLPKPRDWGDDAHMVGYWFLNEAADVSPSPELEAFLNAGDPPIYLGLGSMSTLDPKWLAQRFIDACRTARCRLVIARGWGGLECAPTDDNVLMLDEAPHDLLFPRVAAVIHHGGAGTTAAGLRAGRPTLIFPQVGDQAFWGRRAEILKCGPPMLRPREVTGDTLVDRIRDLIRNEVYRSRASAVAAAIAREDGISGAIELIERATRRRSLVELRT